MPKRHAFRPESLGPLEDRLVLSRMAMGPAQVANLSTVRASRSTSPRSSALAGVTWSASRWPSVSTAMWIFEPFLRLPPS